MLRQISAAILALASVTSAGIADEAWTSDIGGEVIYEDEIGDIAVLSYDGLQPGSRAHFYVPGLPSHLNDRGGEFRGFWIDPAGGECDADLIGPDGLQSNGWGVAIVRFDQPLFPSGFTADIGNCFDGPIFGMRANL
jgi:hypothetical protein